MTDDASEDQTSVAEPAAVRKRRVTQKMREREDARFLDTLLADEAGRRFLWRILTTAGTFNEPFAVGPNGFPQPEATWFSWGKKELGLNLYHTWLRTSPEAVSAMHRENDPRFS